MTLPGVEVLTQHNKYMVELYKDKRLMWNNCDNDPGDVIANSCFKGRKLKRVHGFWYGDVDTKIEVRGKLDDVLSELTDDSLVHVVKSLTYTDVLVFKKAYKAPTLKLDVVHKFHDVEVLNFTPHFNEYKDRMQKQLIDVKSALLVSRNTIYTIYPNNIIQGYTVNYCVLCDCVILDVNGKQSLTIVREPDVTTQVELSDGVYLLCSRWW